MRTIEEIIQDWKVECGVLKNGRNSQYIAIPFGERKSLLLSLAQTMVDEGYGKEDIVSAHTKASVVKACTAPDSAPITPKNVKVWKTMVLDDWEFVKTTFFGGKVSNYVDKRVKEEPKPQKEPDKNPNDRLSVDTTDFVESELDLDFLKEIGVEESFFGTKE